MLSKRHGATGHHGVSCFHHLRSSDPPLKDRKSTRLNSSHSQISYAVFCLKKKKKNYAAVHPDQLIHLDFPRPQRLSGGVGRRHRYVHIVMRYSCSLPTPSLRARSRISTL